MTKTIETTENIFAGKPEKGHVLAIVTDSERLRLKDLSQMIDAQSEANDVSFKQALETRKNWHETWAEVMKNHNVSPLLPIRICLYTGTIYIDE